MLKDVCAILWTDDNQSTLDGPKMEIRFSLTLPILRFRTGRACAATILHPLFLDLLAERGDGGAL